MRTLGQNGSNEKMKSEWNRHVDNKLYTEDDKDNQAPMPYF